MKENKDRIGFQGVKGAFSEQALLKAFKDAKNIIAYDDFRSAFMAIENKEIEFAVLPIENTLGGTILDNINNIIDFSNIYVLKEVQIPIDHNLMAIKGSSLKDIKRVYSHPQALLQCSDYLREKLSKAQAISFFDTAGAADYIKKQNDKSLAAIASKRAATYNSLDILSSSIQSHANNYTRFYVICNKDNYNRLVDKDRLDRIAIVFSVKHEPGSLFNALKIIYENHLNMRKLESIPIVGMPWQYRFFVEIEINDGSLLKEALEQIENISPYFRNLGMFSSAINEDYSLDF